MSLFQDRMSIESPDATGPPALSSNTSSYLSTPLESSENREALHHNPTVNHDFSPKFKYTNQDDVFLDDFHLNCLSKLQAKVKTTDDTDIAVVSTGGWYSQAGLGVVLPLNKHEKSQEKTNLQPKAIGFSRRLQKSSSLGSHSDHQNYNWNSKNPMGETDPQIKKLTKQAIVWSKESIQEDDQQKRHDRNVCFSSYSLDKSPLSTDTVVINDSAPDNMAIKQQDLPARSRFNFVAQKAPSATPLQDKSKISNKVQDLTPLAGRHRFIASTSRITTNTTKMASRHEDDPEEGWINARDSTSVCGSRMTGSGKNTRPHIRRNWNSKWTIRECNTEKDTELRNQHLKNAVDDVVLADFTDGSENNVSVDIMDLKRTKRKLDFRDDQDENYQPIRNVSQRPDMSDLLLGSPLGNEKTHNQPSSSTKSSKIYFWDHKERQVSYHNAQDEAKQFDRASHPQNTIRTHNHQNDFMVPVRLVNIEKPCDINMLLETSSKAHGSNQTGDIDSHKVHQEDPGIDDSMDNFRSLADIVGISRKASEAKQPALTPNFFMCKVYNSRDSGPSHVEAIEKEIIFTYEYDNGTSSVANHGAVKEHDREGLPKNLTNIENIGSSRYENNIFRENIALNSTSEGRSPLNLHSPYHGQKSNKTFCHDLERMSDVKKKFSYSVAVGVSHKSPKAYHRTHNEHCLISNMSSFKDQPNNVTKTSQLMSFKNERDNSCKEESKAFSRFDYWNSTSPNQTVSLFLPSRSNSCTPLKSDCPDQDPTNTKTILQSQIKEFSEDPIYTKTPESANSEPSENRCLKSWEKLKRENCPLFSPTFSSSRRVGSSAIKMEDEYQETIDMFHTQAVSLTPNSVIRKASSSNTSEDEADSEICSFGMEKPKMFCTEERVASKEGVMDVIEENDHSEDSRCSKSRESDGSRNRKVLGKAVKDQICVDLDEWVDETDAISDGPESPEKSENNDVDFPANSICDDAVYGETLFCAVELALGNIETPKPSGGVAMEIVNKMSDVLVDKTHIQEPESPGMHLESTQVNADEGGRFNYDMATQHELTTEEDHFMAKYPFIGDRINVGPNRVDNRSIFMKPERKWPGMGCRENDSNPEVPTHCVAGHRDAITTPSKVQRIAPPRVSAELSKDGSLSECGFQNGKGAKLRVSKEAMERALKMMEES